MTEPSRGAVTAAALALILCPGLALALKAAVYPGWMLFVIVLAALPLALGYILQFVMASVSMLRSHGAFNRVPGAKRGLIAAWLTSLGILLTACFLVDGGDDGVYGSLFTAILGISSTAEGEQLSTTLMYVFALVWLAGWFWLMIEWIVLGSRARRLQNR